MITLAFMVVLVSMIGLIGIIDMIFFQMSFYEFYISVLSLQFGTRRWWVLSAVFIGFIYSVMTDIKRRKANRGVTEDT